ncbi:MAG: hypothetical protein JNK82_03470 [Myxococcaceae bacterium]|nr:hypothetical protein [Myxococcaceae bacterium]
MTLQRPIKSVLHEGAYDAPVTRGWLRVQRKRAVRDTVRKGALAVSCLLLAASVGWAVRPLFPSTMPAPAPSVAPAPQVAAAPLDSLMQALPRVHARTVALQRPAPAAVPAPPAPAPKVEPAAEPVDVVAALLESVRLAYEAGDVSRATALLHEIGEKHADDPRAAQALYVLGLIQLDKQGDAEHAAESFTHALELSPAPELVAPLWQALERARALQQNP